MSAPVLVACAAASLLLAVPVAAAAASLEGGRRAAGAADAAALAAADAASGWIEADPCTLAREVAGAVGATVGECEVDDANGQVRISVTLQTMLGTAQARARAGPSLP